jgi:uncharacterized membrane protein required for colicin V production
MIDIAALVVILLDACIGFRRGLSGAVARFCLLTLGVLATVLLLHPMGSLCFHYASPLIPEQGRYAFAFVATATAACAITMLANRPVYILLDTDPMKRRNRFGGMVTGMLHGLIGVVFVLIVLNLWPNKVVTHAVGEKSIAGRFIGRIVPAIKDRLSSHGSASNLTGEGKRLIEVLRQEKQERLSVTR